MRFCSRTSFQTGEFERDGDQGGRGRPPSCLHASGSCRCTGHGGKEDCKIKLKLKIHLPPPPWSQAVPLGPPPWSQAVPLGPPPWSQAVPLGPPPWSQAVPLGPPPWSQPPGSCGQQIQC
uniref:Uncharacterized protein n=1 Tax=Salarias fasciatus TaxID=181472 RepID=A0A672I8X8_SALFA